MIAEALREILLADAAIADIVGDRVRPILLEQTEGEVGLAVGPLVSTAELAHDGPTGDGEDVWVIACRETTFDKVIVLRQLVVARLNGWQGVAAGTPLTVFYGDSEEAEAYLEEGKGQPLFRHDAEFQIFYGPGSGG